MCKALVVFWARLECTTIHVDVIANLLSELVKAAFRVGGVGCAFWERLQGVLRDESLASLSACAVQVLGGAVRPLGWVWGRLVRGHSTVAVHLHFALVLSRVEPAVKCFPRELGMRQRGGVGGGLDMTILYITQALVRAIPIRKTNTAQVHFLLREKRSGRHASRS